MEMVVKDSSHQSKLRNLKAYKRIVKWSKKRLIRRLTQSVDTESSSDDMEDSLSEDSEDSESEDIMEDEKDHFEEEEEDPTDFDGCMELMGQLIGNAKRLYESKEQNSLYNQQMAIKQLQERHNKIIESKDQELKSKDQELKMMCAEVYRLERELFSGKLEIEAQKREIEAQKRETEAQKQKQEEDMTKEMTAPLKETHKLQKSADKNEDDVSTEIEENQNFWMEMNYYLLRLNQRKRKVTRED